MDLLEAISLLISGALGSLVKDCAVDNNLKLPKKIGGVLNLGFLGGIIIGAAAGYFVDNSPITAFLAGFAGLEAIDRLLPRKTT